MARAWKVPARLALLLAGAWECVAACSSDGAHALAGSCTINTDCNQPLVCAFQKCHNACTDSRDCPAGLRCVSSDRPYRVCQLPEELDCTRTSDCPGAQQCAVDDQCHDRCTTSADCVSRQVCVAASCADVTELGPDGQLAARGDASSATPCAYTSECATPLVCKAGVCQLECLTARDCARGESCIDNVCVGHGSDAGMRGAGGASNGGASNGGASGSGTSSGGASDAGTGMSGVLGAPCDYPSDCPGALRCGPRGTCVYQCSTNFDCAADQCCQEHRCITGNACFADAAIVLPPDAGSGAACGGDLDCQNGVVCDGFERCVAGHCRAAATTACDDADPCTTDTCDEKKGSCTHKVSGPVDEDGDGHYAIGAACAAGTALADDCDDHNPNAYPGHPELCDEADNNCNGIADEGVWHLGPVTALTKDGNYPIGNAGGTETTPAVVAVGGGFDVVATADGTTGAVTGFRLSAAGKLLGTATLATASGTDCPPSSGKRVAYPSLASDGTNLLAGYFQATPMPNTCCQTGFAYWARSALGVVAGGDLSKPSGFRFDEDDFTTCNAAIPSPRVGTPSPVWVPSVQRYITAWADSHAGGGPPLAWVAAVTASGAVGGAHTVTASETDSMVASGFPLVITAASPTRVLAVYASPSLLRLVLLDPASLSAVVGPVDLPDSFQSTPLAAAYSGGKFFIARNTRGLFDVDAVDATTLKPLHTASISLSADALFSPRFITLGSGVFLTFSRGATRLSFGWAPSGFDATLPEIFPLTDVDLGEKVSGAGIAALDTKHIAAAWVDGNVESAILTCGD